jgi:DNA polymerase V
MDLPSFSVPLVGAGFPSPADEWFEAQLVIGELLVPRPTSTFYARCDGDSMEKAGIRHGDILVIDRGLAAPHNSIVIASLGTEGYVVKRLLSTPAGIVLAADHPGYPSIDVAELPAWEIWGVVTYAVTAVDPGALLQFTPRQP